MEESGSSHLLDDDYDIQLAREMQQMEIMLASQDEQNVWLMCSRTSAGGGTVTPLSQGF